MGAESKSEVSKMLCHGGAEAAGNEEQAAGNEEQDAGEEKEENGVVTGSNFFFFKKTVFGSNKVNVIFL